MSMNQARKTRPFTDEELDEKLKNPALRNVLKHTLVPQPNYNDDTMSTENNEKKYMVFGIGCIECADPSELVGFYPDITEAVKARNEAQDRNPHIAFSIYDTDTLIEWGREVYS